jgi:hypothetical protein
MVVSTRKWEKINAENNASRNYIGILEYWSILVNIQVNK